MNQDQQRAAFEAWAAKEGIKTTKWDDGSYLYISTVIGWGAYQAALASPEVKALRKDAERMNWLEKHFTNVSGIYRDGLGQALLFCVDCEDDSLNDGDRGRIRAAIDAAMEKQK